MHIIKHRHLLSPQLFLLFLITLIWYIGDNILEFSLPTYLETHGKSYALIGFLLSLMSISGMLIDMPFGVLSDRLNRKKMMVAGLALSAISSILLFMFTDTFTLAVMFFVWGIGYQLWKVPRDAKFVALADKGRHAQLSGMDTEVKYLGHALGTLLGGFILLNFSFRGITAAYTAFVVLAILLVIVYIKEKGNNRPQTGTLAEINQSISPASFITEIKEIKRYGGYGLYLLLITMLMTGWEAVLWTLEPLFYGPDVLNIPASLGGLLMAFFAIPGIFLPYFVGKFADSKGKATVLLIGMLIMGISLIFLALTHSLFMIFTAALLVSLGWVSVQPALNGLIIDLSYRHSKGKIVGVWDFFMDVGYAIGPFAAGLFAQSFGIRNTFTGIGIIVIVAAGFYFVLKGSEKRAVTANGV